MDDPYFEGCTDYQRVIIDTVATHKTRIDAAAELGISTRALRRHMVVIEALRNGPIVKPPKDPLKFSPVPGPDLPVAELWDRRQEGYDLKHAHEEAAKLRKVEVKIDGPIGILHFGDPHIDDDGTDLGALQRDCEAVRSTEGLFGANIGDTTNNWVGRLSRLYGEQSTTAGQAWKLAEYFLHFCPGQDPWDMKLPERRALLKNWLYLIGGNHDAWSGAGDPLKWMLKQADASYERSQVRLELRFPNGRHCRINARHDFRGTSQWNPAHGSMKACQMGFHDHILVNGHKHRSGYGLIKDPMRGTISHCIQVASYKVHDRYAKDSGFIDQHISPAVVTIINPMAEERGLVTVFHDTEAAVDFLTFLRSR